ncbi:MAG TPA: monofunctional biosynthetic peptidoglycan transglycosylase [Stellaceae bacterium]|nr:monofunctional biosynthetic peptidoglycan transglycosylase [Stellaceae bacterium]
MNMPRAARARPSIGRRLWRIARAIVLLVLLLPIPFVAAYRFLAPPVTPLMLIRSAAGEPIRQRWVPIGEISPWLRRAVVASEDALFCSNYGFDFGEIKEAIERARAGRRLRGASTISQQTAKNLLLWPGRSFLRKGLEAYITVLLELGWPKSRILEVYLNVIEWGPGIYGAEEAAQAHFRKPAAALTRHEAALLAAILPNPRRLSAEHPSPYVEGRASTIEAQMELVQTPGSPKCR